jgi:hypothetical protein
MPCIIREFFISQNRKSRGEKSPLKKRKGGNPYTQWAYFLRGGRGDLHTHSGHFSSFRLVGLMENGERESSLCCKNRIF